MCRRMSENVNVFDGISHGFIPKSGG
jgi:hypothetical protein